MGLVVLGRGLMVLVVLGRGLMVLVVLGRGLMVPVPGFGCLMYRSGGSLRLDFRRIFLFCISSLDSKYIAENWRYTAGDFFGSQIYTGLKTKG
jgi:hypothetical protein